MPRLAKFPVGYGSRGAGRGEASGPPLSWPALPAAACFCRQMQIASPARRPVPANVPRTTPAIISTRRLFFLLPQPRPGENSSISFPSSVTATRSSLDAGFASHKVDSPGVEVHEQVGPREELAPNPAIVLRVDIRSEFRIVWP